MLEFDGATPRLLFTRSIRSTRGGDWQARTDEVLGELREWVLIDVVPYYPRFLISYELSHVDKNVQTALRLADLGGGVRGLALSLDCPCIGVEPAQSKVALTGLSNADKGAMVRAARVLFGVEVPEHEADAIGHALAGQALVRQREIEALR